MPTREEILKEIKRVYDSYYSIQCREEAIVDYIMQLVGQEIATAKAKWNFPTTTDGKHESEL